ncbi:MAG: Uma2 family endonuclease [Cyanobacteria bacterium]|jgi:Uma2 family endonuclease|nr:Uma2 family endonuclease [Cyanobacteria bacterium GSL.Bin1]
MYSATESSLKAFLAQPNIEASPAWELINGRTIQKPMPTLFHSRLQHNLVNYINLHTEELEAIQELRCIIPPYSPVPDIAVIACSRLPEEDGPFSGAPDWLIEIRSPDQSTLDLQSKILHCLNHGTQLAWLIDINRQQIWVWQGDDLPSIYSEAQLLPTLGNLPELRVQDVMAMTQRS